MLTYNLCPRLSCDPTLVGCSTEHKLIRIYNGCPLQRQWSNLPGKEDDVSVDILKRLHDAMLDDYSPRQVYGDGNCLYRAISLGLYGTEDHHWYVCLLTSIEMISHPEQYNVESTDYTKTISDNHVVVLPYRNLVSDVTTAGAWAELMHLYAISASLQMAIQSYEPPSSAIDIGSPYTVVGAGFGVPDGEKDGKTNPRLTVMWTTTTKPRKKF